MIKITILLLIALVISLVVTSARLVLGGALEHMHLVIVSSMLLGAFIVLFMEAFKLDV